MSNRSLSVMGVAVLAASLQPAIAQEQRAALALEEVVVTASKREQSLQDVAVAVTAVSDALIREQHIVSSEDLTALVPSLTLQKGSSPRQSSFNIRGIGTQSFSTGVEPSVSTMLDGVVMGRSGQAFMQLLDIERVEVLRGPQGTLFGKNSTGGVIHIITQDPTEEHTGEAMASMISGGEYRAGATLAGPLSDSLGYRLTASGTDVDGFTRNFHTGNYLNGSKDWSLRGKLRWQGETWDAKWASDYSEAECDCSASPVRSLEPHNGNDDTVQAILDQMAPAVPGEENTRVNIDQEPFSESEQWGHSLEINWDVGEYTLTSISALRGYEIDARSDGDLDSRPVHVLGFEQGEFTEQQQFTQELRITSPAEDRFNYVAGLFYFDQEVDREFRRDLAIIPALPGYIETDFSADTTNWAAFGEANWMLGDRWRLILGARYTRDELDYRYERTREGFPFGLPPSVLPQGDGTDEDDLSGKLALQWDYSDDGMAYLSYTQGYKGPAYDLTTSTDPETLQPVAPETSDAWEFGVKTSLWNNRLQLNAALFHAVYDDFQSQAFLDPDGEADCAVDNPGCDPSNQPGAFLLINAGEVSTQGLELDFLALLSENLRVSGGIALVDATIDDFPAGQCSSGQEYRGECPDGLQDLSGGDLPFSPDWKVNLSAAYTWRRNDWFDVVFTGMVRAQDEVQYGLHQDENTVGDSYSIVDLSARLESHDDSWEATFFVKNATDEFYPSVIFSMSSTFLPNGYLHRYGRMAERQYGAELRYRW